MENQAVEKGLVLSDTSRKRCREQFKLQYNSVLSKGFIVETLNAQHAVNRKADKEVVLNHICQELKHSYDQILDRETEIFYHQADMTAQSQNSKWGVQDARPQANIIVPHTFVPGVDVQQIRITGMAGGITFGILAIWAEIVAHDSNLGAYILIAKFVSWLCNLGISLGGTYHVAHMVALIGGPVVLGIVAALIVAAIAWGITAMNWKERFANQVIQEFQEQGICDLYEKQFDDYWDIIQKEQQIEIEWNILQETQIRQRRDGADLERTAQNPS